MHRLLILIISVFLLADKNSTFNAYTLLDLFFPFDFVNDVKGDSGSVEIGTGRTKRHTLKNESLNVLARVDFSLPEYLLGNFTIFWGGKWNQIKDFSDADWRAHHIGLRYHIEDEQGSGFWVKPLLHILDAKDLNKQNKGVEINAGGSLPLGLLNIYGEIGGYIRIDEDILASLGDSTIRKLKGKFGAKLSLFEEDMLDVGLLAQEAKISKAAISGFCPSLSYKFQNFGINADYCFLKGDDNVTDLYPILPILGQASENGTYLDLSADYDLQLHEKFSIKPEVGFILGDFSGWKAVLQATLGF